MKRYGKLVLISFILCTALFGCEDEKVETINTLVETNKGTYTYVIPFEATDTRNYHSTYQSVYNINEVGKKMEDLSLDYFSNEEYYAQEGQIIDRTVLSNLVGRESDTNPQGLNPSKGSEFAVSNSKTIVDAIVITDVFELDFIKKNDSNYETSAMTIALVVNEEQTYEDKTYNIDEKHLWEYSTNAGRKLESYLRTLQEVQNIPILILIYNSSSSDAYLPGGVLGYAYYSGRSGQFNQFETKWVLLPTSEASNLDNTTYNQFLTFKSALKEYLPENITIIGKAEYQNDELVYLRINVGVQAKTYAEVKSLTQYCAQQLSNFTETSVKIIVNIKSNDETFALIERSSLKDLDIIYIY